MVLCGLLLLTLTMVGERAFAAGAERSTAGKQRTAGASAKGRKRNVRQQVKSKRRVAGAAPAKQTKKARQATRPVAKAAVGAAGAATAAAAAPTASAQPELLPRCGFTEASRRHLFSHAIYVLDEQSGATLYERNAEQVAPIASISKLMMAMVWLDQKHEALASRLAVTEDDLDTLKYTQSRLNVGASVTRGDMLHIALMSSENRAAAALSRDYPGGREAFIAAMNAKAQALAMPHTRFVNATGLSPDNVSTAKELASMVRAANGYALIREYSVDRGKTVNIGRGQLQYVNSNRLVRYRQVSASVQKTGFINEAGHNMVMRLLVHGRRPVVVSMLGSDTGEGSRLDGVRIAQWLNCSLR
ncbi:serine hydrolase [Herbaspirillum sp. LeCh32-8]|nr:serine hydrolase [Herbaspirillum sp. LeCh32-8]